MKNKALFILPMAVLAFSACSPKTSSKKKSSSVGDEQTSNADQSQPGEPSENNGTSTFHPTTIPLTSTSIFDTTIINPSTSATSQGGNSSTSQGGTSSTSHAGTSSTSHAGTSSTSQGGGSSSATSATSQPSSSSSSSSIPSADFSNLTITTKGDVASYSIEGNVLKITTAGTYTFSGSVNEGYIEVNAGDEDEVDFVFNNFSINCSSQSPVICWNADSFKIKSENGSTNTVVDARPLKEEDDDTQGNGAIYSKCDLSLTGKGTLTVYTSCNNGVHSTKDLSIKNTTLNVQAVNNAFKGNDAVEIESGKLTLISTRGNGIVTEDTDVSSKGNQRGIITISGGTVTIFAAKDAIDASYNVEILDGGDGAPTIDLRTSNFSTYSEEVISTSETEKYLRVTSQLSSSYKYAVYAEGSASPEWCDVSFYKSVTGRSTYYYYKFNIKDSVSRITVYKFNSASEYSLDSYVAKTSSISISSYYDSLTVNDNGSSMSTGGWTNISQSQGGGGPGGGGPGGGPSEGNSDKLDYSAKGIKAGNNINIAAGTITVQSHDDAIHANYGDTLENGETSVGDITISGGTFTLYSTDDAIHADRYLNISGGNIKVSSSYEGIEANIINISGGDTLIYATDDGANAANKAGLSPAINISGGRLDISVASGDTDGIDSNGTYTQTAGLVISRGSGGGMSTGLDTDSTAKVNGGTLLVFGSPERTPTCGTGVSKSTISGTFSSGTYLFTGGSLSFETTNIQSYSGAYFFSSDASSFSYTKK